VSFRYPQTDNGKLQWQRRAVNRDTSAARSIFTRDEPAADFGDARHCAGPVEPLKPI
jgi:hypothetical protein